ncbi:biotin--[acetyl-CoA-carboxylase] ligase [Evansella tamaricis]|uniref:Bifunctional ligase/repressor BirA n=1 Tax=Evansella tamaricis TaxID=2069301 RepID=A0ABS6JP88_9BACI|nr:biotin--[acetyl-CoA-carboxylase] ligase [Evansella tamaricis]MBU9714622.1 biotin--[acetyl-CoA-carboxylase] ligase [Evansella tamaricis]
MLVRVLQLLRDNQHQFLSGEKISEELGCSRTMVWKYIESLRKEGNEILAVSNKGYQLIGETDQLSEHEIKSRLMEDSLFKHVHFKDNVDSTQIVAQRLVNEGAHTGTIVIANEQTLGRGRLGREWFSPPDTGIWMSIIVRPEIELREAPQLTLVTAVAVARAISNVTDLEVGIKWPNDILINGKKVVGILTEMQADPDRVNSVIIGIGINTNQEKFPNELKKIATSLSMEKGKKINRAELIIQILKEFEWLYDAYLTMGFQFIKPLWEARAVSIGKRVKAVTTKEVFYGMAIGIDDQGVLLLEDDDGKIHPVYSADINHTMD